MTRRLPGLSLLAVMAASLTASAGDQRPLEDRLREAMERRLRQHRVNGASAAVVLPDGSIKLAAAGISHGSVRMSPDMAFAVGSITKNMVAALALQLAEEGRLSLDDPIEKWLPPYPHVDGAITLRQLLDHTSGLYMFFENQQLWDDLIKDRERIFTTEEVLGYLKDPYFAPGKGFRYSNTNALLVAMIITRVTGSTLAVEFRRRFWEPLGLTSARLPLEEPYPETLAHVWGDNFEKDGAYRDITFLPRASHDSIGCPAAFMTPGDLARWTHALFHGELISGESLAEMQTFGARGSYGLGLQRFPRMRMGGMRAFGHGGGSIGAEAHMVYMPDHDVCIALMINHFGGKCSSVMLRDIGTITIQHLKPHALLLSFWSVESWMSLAWLLTGAGAVVYAIRRKRPATLLVFGVAAMASGWVSTRLFVSLAMVLIPEGALLLLAGAGWHVRRRMSRAGGGHGRA